MLIKEIKVKNSKKVEDEHLRVFASFSHLNSGILDKMISRWHPPTDVFHTEDKLVVLCEVAGISRENIKIIQDSNILKIEGERVEIPSEKRATFLNMEINYGPFERNIHLPREFVGGEIIAKYSNGFLKIEVSRVPTSTVNVEIE